MKRIANWLWVSLLLATSAGQAQGLSEDGVRALVAEMDRIVESGQFHELNMILHDSVRIEIRVNFNGQAQVIQPSKNEHIAMLEQSRAMYSEYSFERTQLEISLQGNSAIVRESVSERVTIQGQTLSMLSSSVSTIQQVGGRLQVVSIIAEGSM